MNGGAGPAGQVSHGGSEHARRRHLQVMKRGAPPRSLPSCPLRSPFGPSSNLSFYSDYRSTTYPFTLTIAQQQIRSHPLTLSPSHPSTLSPAYPVPDRNPIAWLLGMFKEPHHTVPPHSSLEAWVQKDKLLSDSQSKRISWS